MSYTLHPRFHLAFRRALLYLIILVLYWLIGSVILFALLKTSSPPAKVQSQSVSQRLDFERSELLNVLYSESIGRSEHDWALLANQKLDSYERSLMDRADSGYIQKNQQITLTLAMRYSFSLITTIGPIDIDDLTTESKIFCMIFATFGIPLMLLYLGQCAKTLEALLAGIWNLFFAALGTMILLAVVYDIVEQNTDDTPFIDAILTVFLSLSTVGCEDDKDELPSALLYIGSIVGLSAFSVAFAALRHQYEKIVSPYELGFTLQVAHLERVISGNKLEVLEEDDVGEEESEYT